ncbi:MAG: ATP-binding protein, partial [Clostridia bacterium]|nr:ATP-binding protein [Clostridia bacterium]
GTGKTYVSSCIANRALERGFTVYYQSAFKLLDMLEKLKFGRYEDEERAQAEYAEKYIYDVDLLIIDDVGTEFVTAYSSAALFDIINSRIVDKKSTIISSNLGPVKMTEVYGTRLASRITGSFDVVNFIGKDLRRIKK